MNIAAAATTRSKVAEPECESRWSAYQAQTNGDVGALREKWLAEKGGCGGTGVYEYHLATLAELEGKYDEAISILQKALSDGLPHRDQLYVTMLGMRFNRADAERPRDKKEMRAANGELEEFVRKNSKFMAPVHVAASQRARLRDFKEAETLARRGLAANPESALSVSALVTSLAATERCEEAKPMVRPALEKHDLLFEDYDFMMAAAFCYYHTGDFLTAEQALKALKMRLPGSENEESFKKLARLVLKEKTTAKPE